MKQFSLFQVVVLALLAVTIVSCGVPMGTTGDYYEDAPTRRNAYYYSDSYLGGGNTIIVERDPYTGRYYQVNPGYYGGSVYGAPVYPRGNRVYNNRSRGHNNRTYNDNRSNNNGRNNGYYRTYPQTQQPQRQQPAQRQPALKERQEAKDAILGKPRN